MVETVAETGGSDRGGRSRGQWFAAVASVAKASAAKSGNGGGRQRWRKQRGSARAKNNQPISGSNSSKNGGGGVGCSQRRQWRRQRGSHSSGDGGANMGPTVTEGVADVGGRSSSFVLLFAIQYV